MPHLKKPDRTERKSLLFPFSNIPATFAPNKGFPQVSPLIFKITKGSRETTVTLMSGPVFEQILPNVKMLKEEEHLFLRRSPER